MLGHADLVVLGYPLLTLIREFWHFSKQTLPYLHLQHPNQSQQNAVSNPASLPSDQSPAAQRSISRLSLNWPSLLSYKIDNEEAYFTPDGGICVDLS